MSSRRLRGKALRRLGNDVVLGYVVEAMRRVDGQSRLVVATSIHPEDDAIAAWCNDRQVECFRGSLVDVASRALAVSERYAFDSFVRVSGDSPLIDPRLVGYAIDLFREESCDIVSNVYPRSFPPGQSVEVVRRSALAAAYESGMSAHEKEHVTIAMYGRPDLYKVVNFGAENRASAGSLNDLVALSLAIDTQADLELCREILKVIRPRQPWEEGWRRLAAIATRVPRATF